MQNNAKEKILSRIRAVQTERLISVNQVDALEIYRPVSPDSLQCFVTESESVNSKCIIYKEESELQLHISRILEERNINKLFCRDKSISKCLQQSTLKITSEEEEFEGMEAGITNCEYLIARTGSVMVSSGSGSGRQMHAYPPLHIVLANSNQLVDYPGDALEAIQQRYKNNLPSYISLITGPSRTADIEKTLVLGAHGPKELIIMIQEKA